MQSDTTKAVLSKRSRAIVHGKPHLFSADLLQVQRIRVCAWIGFVVQRRSLLAGTGTPIDKELLRESSFRSGNCHSLPAASSHHSGRSSTPPLPPLSSISRSETFFGEGRGLPSMAEKRRRLDEVSLWNKMSLAAAILTREGLLLTRCWDFAYSNLPFSLKVEGVPATFLRRVPWLHLRTSVAFL